MVAPPEPSPSPVSSAFTITPGHSCSELRFPSPLGLSLESVGRFFPRPPCNQDSAILDSLAALQNQLFALQDQLNAAVNHVQDLTQHVLLSRGKSDDSHRGATRPPHGDGAESENFVITSFDGKAVRFN